jgi:hypothetical protein
MNPNTSRARATAETTTRRRVMAGLRRIRFSPLGYLVAAPWSAQLSLLRHKYFAPARVLFTRKAIDLGET